jgi:glycosyltransferase involved in cell wall biosynthesis
LTLVADRGPKDLRVVRDILRLCKSQDIELLQSHDYKTNALALLIRRFHRCKLATMLHGWTDMSGRMPLYKKIDQWCLPHFDKLICVSKDLVEECNHLRIPSKKVHLVHNAIDLESFTRTQSICEAKSQMGARSERYLIGSVGRLSPEKGFLPLLRVVRRLQDRGFPLDLWIAGDGPQRDELTRNLLELGLEDSVKLLGQVSDPRPFYQAMDLFVLNSIREGLPNVLLEAMALEVPVIATRIAGIPDLVRDGETGRLIEANADASLEQAIADSLQSGERTIGLAREARRHIEEEFSFETRMARVAAIYDELLGRRPQQ